MNQYSRLNTGKNIDHLEQKLKSTNSGSAANTLLHCYYQRIITVSYIIAQEDTVAYNSILMFHYRLGLLFLQGGLVQYCLSCCKVLNTYYALYLKDILLPPHHAHLSQLLNPNLTHFRSLFYLNTLSLTIQGLYRCVNQLSKSCQIPKL